MMLSFGKIFWLLVILAVVWYGFKIVEKRKIQDKDSNNNKEVITIHPGTSYIE